MQHLLFLTLQMAKIELVVLPKFNACYYWIGLNDMKFFILSRESRFILGICRVLMMKMKIYHETITCPLFDSTDYYPDFIVC